MEADMAKRADKWVAIGLDNQVQAGSSNPVIVGGYALAMWRAEDSRPESGPINVWEDRCVHRGMRLSHGFVRGGMLRCIYHGWGYEADGRCTSIPAHPELTPPKTFCANVYSSETRYGIVWTNLAEEPSAPLPDVADKNGWTPIRSIYVKRPIETVEDGIKAFDHGDCKVIDTGSGITVIRFEDASLMLAAQSVESEKTAVHVVGKGGAASSIELRLRLATQMERLRDAIEAC